MELFRLYIRQRRRCAAAFCVFTAIFAASFLLYRLPLKAVLYPAGLCALLGAVFIAADFSRIRKKHKALLALQKLSAATINALPDIDGVEDSDYQAIIKALQRETAELSSTAIRRYQDMTEYYTTWAHQIKTPIAAMRLRLNGEDSAFSRGLLPDLFRIEQYVEMVMAFIRLDGNGDYVFREQELDAVIKGAVRKFAPEFIARKISLEYEPVKLRIVTDGKWLSFVIEQLLSNALKYTASGGSVKIYAPGALTLCIEDTGAGIAAEDLPRIFEKGYTGLNGRLDKSASGIGLYLCRRICKNLGAGISARSKINEGTCMSIEFEQYKTGAE